MEDLQGVSLSQLHALVVALGLLANIAQVNGTQIPNLYLAENLSPILATGFSVIILAGIYTTAVPLLWTVASRIFDDSTMKFKMLALALATVGCVIGLLIPFSKMVNIVYVINGYVGIVLLVLMLVKTGKRLLKMETLEKSSKKRLRVKRGDKVGYSIVTNNPNVAVKVCKRYLCRRDCRRCIG